MPEKIHASVKMTPKIRDTFYSIEYGEERSVDPNKPIDNQRQELFDDCFEQVIMQIELIKKEAGVR